MNVTTSYKLLKKNCILLLLLFFCINNTFAQDRTEISVDFRVGVSTIEQGYSNNAERLSDIISFLQDIKQDNTIEIEHISFNGAASPEGSFELNRKLALDRLTSLEKYISKHVAMPNDITITRNDQYIHWDYLISLVENSDIAYKDKVLAILNGESQLTEYPGERRVDSRIVQLKSLDNGKVWQTMLHRFFSGMRSASVVVETVKKELPPIEEIEEESGTIIDEMEESEAEPAPIIEEDEKEQPVVFIDTQPELKEWTQQLYLKTNAVGWSMLVANVAIELDLSPHWSVALPVYYSGWDYFSHDRKYRTFTVQPEIRYWLKENDGFFFGAHLGLAYYNFAWKGNDYRIQDKDKKTPALGGGLSAGYRLPISKNNRWKMEFSVGAGVYDLEYNKFHNQRNGFMVETIKETFFGIDQVAVSFSYMFDFKKKKK